MKYYQVEWHDLGTTNTLSATNYLVVSLTPTKGHFDLHAKCPFLRTCGSFKVQQMYLVENCVSNKSISKRMGERSINSID